MLGFEGVRQRIFLQTAGNCESTDVIRFAAQFRRNKVRQAVVGETDFFRLLAQVMTDVDDVRTRLVTVNLDVVPTRLAGNKPTTPRGFRVFSALSLSSMSLASLNRRFASSPTTSSSRMRGYFPASDQS